MIILVNIFSKSLILFYFRSMYLNIHNYSISISCLNTLIISMDYINLSYRELQVELKSRGLRANGKKDELAYRLEESDMHGYIGSKHENSNECTTKIFHVRTMIGIWYDIPLLVNQTIGDLMVLISDITGALIYQIKLSTQEGVVLDEEYPVRAFKFPEVFLNMTIRLCTRK